MVYKIKQMESKNQNAILINLGSTLRQLRMRKGFKSAEVFSFENELNRTAYWRWENGKNITMKTYYDFVIFIRFRRRNYSKLLRINITGISPMNFSMNQKV